MKNLIPLNGKNKNRLESYFHFTVSVQASMRSRTLSEGNRQLRFCPSIVKIISRNYSSDSIIFLAAGHSLKFLIPAPINESPAAKVINHFCSALRHSERTRGNVIFILARADSLCSFFLVSSFLLLEAVFLRLGQEEKCVSCV